MKTKNVIIISIIGLIVVGISIGWFMYNKGPINVHSENAINVSAEDIYETFKKDSTTAQKLYNNKVVQVTGIVERIQSNNEKAQILLLHTNEESAFVNCTLEEPSSLQTGNRVIVKGICGGIGQGDEDLGLKGDVYVTRAFIIQ